MRFFLICWLFCCSLVIMEMGEEATQKPYYGIECVRLLPPDPVFARHPCGLSGKLCYCHLKSEP